MVVDNAPTLWETLKNQSEDTASVANGATEVPFPEDQCRIRTEGTDFKSRELKLSHGFGVGIGLPIPIEEAIVAANCAVRAGKSEIGRVPIALKEDRDVGA